MKQITIVIASAIRRVPKGPLCFTPSIAHNLERRRIQVAGANPLLENAPALMHREMEVRQLIVEGNANKGIR